MKERGPEGHLSISAGVKWAGACAVLLRTAALSLTLDAAGAAHPCTANVEATAGVPRRGGGAFSIFAAVRAYLERARQRSVSSADGEHEYARGLSVIFAPGMLDLAIPLLRHSERVLRAYRNICTVFRLDL